MAQKPRKVTQNGTKSMKMMQNGTKPLANLYPRSWPGGWASVNRRATEKARPASSIEIADQIPSQGATKTVGCRFCEQNYAKNSGTILYPRSWSGAWALETDVRRKRRARSRHWNSRTENLAEGLAKILVFNFCEPNFTIWGVARVYVPKSCFFMVSGLRPKN